MTCDHPDRGLPCIYKALRRTLAIHSSTDHQPENTSPKKNQPATSMPRSTQPRKKTTGQQQQVMEVTPDEECTSGTESQQQEEPNVLVQPEQASTSEGPPPPPQPKKQYRVSHKNIEDYKFTEEQVQTLVDFIKEHPCLYDKRHREYSNHRTKLDLWHQCASLFPSATHLQCRKYFEQKRTAFGKIEAMEMKSGAEARARTAREEDIMNTWGFFKGHIAHATTTSSQRFSSGHESSSNSDASGLSAASIQRRKVLKKRRMGDVTSPKDATNDPEPEDTRVISNLIERAAALTQQQPQQQASWCGTEIETFSKLVAYKMANVHPDDLDEAMIQVQSVIQRFVAKRKSAPTPAQPQPVQPPPTTRPATPATFAQWMPIPPKPMTPSPAGYQSMPQHTMPYAIPSTSGYQPTYGPPPVGPPHSLQPLQQYPPQSLGYVAVGASTSTNVQTVSSPSKSFLQQIDTLPPLTPQMTTQEQYLSPSSSLNTPKAADVAEET